MPRSPQRRVTLLATAAVLIAAASVMFTVPAARAAGACRVDYAVNQWTGGFTANVTLTVTEARSAWTVTWTYPGDQRITSAWSAQVGQSGNAVTATNLAYNGAIAAGASVQFGVQGTYVTGNPVPTSFALDAVLCGDAPAPTDTPTAAGADAHAIHRSDTHGQPHTTGGLCRRGVLRRL